MKKVITDSAVAEKFINTKQSATSRGLAFNLSLRTVKRLLSAKKCYFTGKPFSNNNVLSFDRLDNSKGYVEGNVVACSKKFNSKKGELSVTEIELLYKGLKKKNLVK